jgi:hypothetical protein
MFCRSGRTVCNDATKAYRHTGRTASCKLLAKTATAKACRASKTKSWLANLDAAEKEMQQKLIKVQRCYEDEMKRWSKGVKELRMLQQSSKEVPEQHKRKNY